DAYQGCVERPRMSHVADRLETVHQVGLAADGREWQARAERFANRADVGRDAKVLLSAPGTLLGKRLNLVEEQNQVVFRGETLCRLQKPRLRQDAAAIVVNR